MTRIAAAWGARAIVLAAALAASPAVAQDGWSLAGSFGDNGFSRYVPPVTNPLFNETPFITTEAKPIYIYHHISSDFISGGGSVNVVALQARVALTERLGFIATADGYSWVDFDNTLADDNGWNDLAAGLKYAFYSDPAEGAIASIGARYTAPTGTLDTRIKGVPGSNIDLNGTGNGYIDVFATGAKLFDKAQIQGSFGTQIALSDKNWSFFHGSLHADYEVMPGFFPLIEANLTAPFDGGNRLKGLNLTGADIVDIGASDPETILGLAIGARLRLADNIIAGAAFEKNVLENEITGTNGTEASVWGWRVTTDLTIRF